MLKASLVEVHLTAADVAEAVATRAAGKVQDVQATLTEGALLLRLKVVDRLPMAVPVDLRFTIRALRGTVLELGVAWSNMPLVPGFLKELALQKAFEALPGEYRQGVFTIDVTDVMDEMPVSFRVADVRVQPDHVAVQIADVMVFPLAPAAPADDAPAAAAIALVPTPCEEEAKLPEHQNYYHQLRCRAKEWAGAKAPKWVQPLVPWVLAVPDFFVLLVRLAKDPRVPATVKVMATAVVAYMVTPVDLIPDVIPLIGQVDDVAVAVFALEQIAQRVPADVVQELWPGDDRVIDLVKEGTQLFRRALPGKMMDAIRQVISRGQS